MRGSSSPTSGALHARAAFKRLRSLATANPFRRGVLEGKPVMAGAYSADLRERVLRTCARGRLSRARIAALFQVAESTVYRWLETWRSGSASAPA